MQFKCSFILCRSFLSFFNHTTHTYKFDSYLSILQKELTLLPVVFTSLEIIFSDSLKTRFPIIQKSMMHAFYFNSHGV